MLPRCVPTLIRDDHWWRIGGQHLHPKPREKSRERFIANPKAKYALICLQQALPVKNRNDPNKFPRLAMHMRRINRQRVADLGVQYLAELRFRTKLRGRRGKGWGAEYYRDGRIGG